MDSEEEEIIYSDEESEMNGLNGEEEEAAWKIDWNNMVCVDEYGEDGDNRMEEVKTSEVASSGNEFDELELDAVDELDDICDAPKLSNEKEKEKERESRSDDDKKESEGEEGDPWSRWMGVENGEEKRKEEKKEEKREGRRRDETKMEEGRRHERKLTLAEKVLMGKVREGEATKDTRSRVVGRSPPRREERRRGSPSRDRRPLPSHSMRMERRSPLREGRDGPSHERRRERSPRRREESPARKERRRSPARREKRERSPERRRGGRETHRTSPSRPVRREERSALPRMRDIPSIPKLSSPNRTIRKRSRSPLSGKGDECHRKISSPNRVKIGERSIVRKERKEISPRREEVRRKRSRSPISIPRKELPSLLDVKIQPSLPRMEGRVKREEKEERKEREERKKEEEERPKERDERDGREERKREERKREKEEEKKEERKRHVPIVWNEKETDAKKMHRSIGHVEGIETIERKVKEERIEDKMRLEKVGSAIVPSSIAARVAKFSLDATHKERSMVLPPKDEVEEKKSLHSTSPHLPLAPTETTAMKSLDSLPHLPRLQPTALVRTITNNDAVMKRPDQPKEKKRIEMEEEEEGEIGTDEDCEDEGGWLSSKLQQGGNVIPIDSSSKSEKKNDPSSAALRLFGRATASAVSSSTLKDARRTIKKEVRRPIKAPDLFGVKNGGTTTNKVMRRMEGRIEKRPLNDAFGKKKIRNIPSNEVSELVPSSNLPRLLDVYY